MRIVLQLRGGSMLEYNEEMKLVFEKEGVLQLADFLSKEDFKNTLSDISTLSFTKKVDPVKYSYSESELPGSLRLLSSEEFSNLIFKITGQRVANFKLRSFAHRDYTLLHDDIKEGAGIDVFYDLTVDWPEHAGGFLSYTDGEKELLHIEPLANSLVIVRRDDKMMKFLKYVNVRAADKKRVLANSFN